ncbi:unnamed protein product [Rhodiola kirilowii]
MGTKIENAVNLLAGSSQKTSILDEWGAACKKAQPLHKDNNSQTITHFRNLQNSMDRIANELYTFESIRNALLEHDHLFKQQVKELHRLYGVQKMLMNELKFKENLTKQPRCFDLERHDNERAGETRRVGTKTSYNCEEEEEPEIELTLSIGNQKNSNKRMKTSQQPHCNMNLVYSNSISNHFQIKHLQNGDKERNPRREECSNNTAASDEERLKNRPHWLLQSLSSHKT